MPIDEEIKAASTLASTKASPQDLSLDDDGIVQFGDEDALSKSGLQKIVPADKSSVVRCACLVDVTPIRMKWLHFILGSDGKKRPYRCLSKRDKKHNIITEGPCCAKLKNSDEQRAQLNFAVLGLKYKNADPATGKYKAVLNPATGQKEAPPITWELGWIKLSQSGFQGITDLMFESEERALFDIGIRYKANGIGFDYLRLTDTISLFRKSPEFLAEVMEEAAKFANGEFLMRQLGKQVTEIEMKAILSGNTAAATGGTHTSQIDNTDDL